MPKDSLSDQDKALFREQMRHVEPLKKQSKKIDQQKPTVPKPNSRIKTITEHETSHYFLSDYINNSVQSNSILSYCLPEFPSKRFRALKNGLIAWEARLDLHGLHSDNAREALIHFIKKQIGEQKRCILIIHGKGGHQGEEPIIKNLVNRWLPQFPEVLAFHSAIAKDGGTGAVYVLLKKNRY